MNFLTQRQTLIGSSIIILLLFILNLLVPAILMAATIAVSFIVNTVGLRKFGVELALFSTVLIGMAHGPIVGAIIGFILISAHMIIGQYLDMYVLWVIPGYVIAGFAAGFLENPTIVGPIIAIVVNIAFSICTALFNPGFLTRFFTHALGNVAFNWILFTVFGNLVLNALI